MVLLEELGRSLFPSPLISSALAASAILDAGDESQRARWLPGLADGSRIGTLAILEESGGLEPGAIRLRGELDGDAYLLSGDKRFVADAGGIDVPLILP